jgi:hypothetical protein
MNSTSVQEKFGFRKGASTESAASEITANTINVINQKMHVVGIFCALRKASDRIVPRIFLILMNSH